MNSVWVVFVLHQLSLKNHACLYYIFLSHPFINWCAGFVSTPVIRFFPAHNHGKPSQGGLEDCLTIGHCHIISLITQQVVLRGIAQQYSDYTLRTSSSPGKSSRWRDYGKGRDTSISVSKEPILPHYSCCCSIPRVSLCSLQVIHYAVQATFYHA
jgi:hypothetical protein